jgi:hypothetical protein
MTSTRLRLAAAAGILACLPLGQMMAAERSIAAMASAANRFLAELTPEQRQQAAFPVASDERTRWHFIAPLAPAGVPASAMTAAQQATLMQLIEAYTSVVADDLAADRLARLTAAGRERITFA